MSTVSLTSPYYQKLAAEHREWLGTFDPRYLVMWEHLLNSNLEAALSESGVRRFLQREGLKVAPGEDLDSGMGGPDFQCSTSTELFYVEVTNIAEDMADTKTVFRRDTSKAGRFFSLNDNIFRKCRKKARQCGKIKAPVLLAVATFSCASILAFSSPYPEQLLTGIICHSIHLDKRTGKAIGVSKESELRSAPFLYMKDNNIKQARASISGLLLCGLKFSPEIVVGVLNPHAVYPFNPCCLPGVSFSHMVVNVEEGIVHTYLTGDTHD